MTVEIIEKDGQKFIKRGSLIKPYREPAKPKERPQQRYLPAPVNLVCGNIKIPSTASGKVCQWIAPCRGRITNLTIHMNALTGAAHANGLVMRGDDEVQGFTAREGRTEIRATSIPVRAYDMLKIFLETEFPEPALAEQVWVTFMFDNRETDFE